MSTLDLCHKDRHDLLMARGMLFVGSPSAPSRRHSTPLSAMFAGSSGPVTWLL